MADLLCFGTRNQPPHRQFSDQDNMEAAIDSEFIDVRLRGYAEREVLDTAAQETKESPYFKSFIEPFLEHLMRVRQAGTLARPPQPGDPELRKIQLAAGMP